MKTEDNGAVGADEDLIVTLSRLTKDLVLLGHRAMDRPVQEDRLPYLLAGLALTAQLAQKTLQDCLVSEGLDPEAEDGLINDLVADDIRVYRAWHILETVGLRPCIVNGICGPGWSMPKSLATFSAFGEPPQQAVDRAMDDLLRLETPELNRLHTEVVLIDGSLTQ